MVEPKILGQPDSVRTCLVLSIFNKENFGLRGCLVNMLLILFWQFYSKENKFLSNKALTNKDNNKNIKNIFKNKSFIFAYSQ
jgi:hypothetical protein